MLPKWHIILGFLFSLILFLILNLTFIQFLIIFFSSFIFDFDHFLFYIFRKKSINLKKAYYWHKNLPKNHKPIMHFFHTIEFLFILIFLSAIFPMFILMTIGILFHNILDLIDMIRSKKLNAREFSFIRYLILRKNKEIYFK